MIRIHILHEASVGEPAKEYNIFTFSPVMLSALESHHVPTIPLRKKIREIRSLNVLFI